MKGKINIAAGFIVMGLFMLYGFFLIYLRDFAPGKEEWAASYPTGKHFEARLAHVHGNLFAFLNIVIGYLLTRFGSDLCCSKGISGLALAGMLMPLGILTEVYLGFPPFFVLVGAVSMTVSVFLMGWGFIRMKKQTAD